MAQSRPSARSLRSLPMAALGLGLALTQAGCPQGADLENPEQYPQLAVGTGGSGGTGGIPAATGGKSGAGGKAGTGSGGMGSGGTPPVVLTEEMVGCNFAAVIGDGTTANKGSCAYTGCHAVRLPIAGLDLTANMGLVARLKDVPALHRDIQCSGPDEPYMECIPPPAGCPDAKLVDSVDVDASWILQKVNGTQGDCGAQMPDGVLEDDKIECIDKLVRAIAALP